MARRARRARRHRQGTPARACGRDGRLSDRRSRAPREHGEGRAHRPRERQWPLRRRRVRERQGAPHPRHAADFAPLLAPQGPGERAPASPIPSPCTRRAASPSFSLALQSLSLRRVALAAHFRRSHDQTRLIASSAEPAHASEPDACAAPCPHVHRRATRQRARHKAAALLRNCRGGTSREHDCRRARGDGRS